MRARRFQGRGASFVIMIAFTAAMPAGADERAASALLVYCTTKLNVPAGVCDCLIKQFGKLNEGQQALVEARLLDQRAALDGLRAALLPTDAEQAEAFLARETLLCRPSGQRDYLGDDGVPT